MDPTAENWMLMFLALNMTGWWYTYKTPVARCSGAAEAGVPSVWEACGRVIPGAGVEAAGAGIFQPAP